MSKYKSVMRVDGSAVNVVLDGGETGVSLTDIALHMRPFDKPDAVIRAWLRNERTIGMLSAWEQANNPSFKPVDIDWFRKAKNSDRIKYWVEATNAIGIYAKRGRYGGGAFAHWQIALNFARWLDPRYGYEAEQRILERMREHGTSELERARLSATDKKVLLTDALKAREVTDDLSDSVRRKLYAREMDAINDAVYEMFAWEFANGQPHLSGNHRDHSELARLEAVIMLQVSGAALVNAGVPFEERVRIYKQTALRLGLPGRLIGKCNAAKTT